MISSHEIRFHFPQSHVLSLHQFFPAPSPTTPQPPQVPRPLAHTIYCGSGSSTAGPTPTQRALRVTPSLLYFSSVPPMEDYRYCNL